MVSIIKSASGIMYLLQTPGVLSFCYNLVQILLHSPEEFPLVKDLGFAVAPGSHTLVAVERTRVGTMKPCIKDD